MPLYASIPLPGPLRYSMRLTGRHHRHRGVGPAKAIGLLFYWLIMIEVYMVVGIALGCWYGSIYAYRGIHATVRVIQAWRAQR